MSNGHPELMPLFTTGSASMRATVASRETIKAARPAALERKMGGSRTVLERKHQAGGGDGGMSIFINFEAGHLEIGNFINESAILCAHEEMF